MTTYNEYTYTSKNDPLKLTVAALPTKIAADEVLVKVHSASLNPVDALVYNSSYGSLSFLTGKMGTGRDYSGVVEKVGADVTAKLGIKQGDRVVGLYRHFFQKGTLAEYVLVKPFSEADQAFSKVPETLTMEQAASFPLVLLTAFSMTEGHKLENSKILVLGGATSVGRYVIQLAKAAGAASIVTTNSARSNELVQSLGSTAQIDYHQHKSLRDPVLEAAKSAPFNYVYDCAGNDQLFGIMSKIVDPNDNGYVTIVGEHHYDYKNEHGLGLAYMSMKTKVRGLASCLGLLGYKYRFDMMKPRKAWFDKGFEMFNSGELKPFVDTVYKFEESPKAWDKLVSGTASGKIVVNVNPAV
ncbi:enoyl-[acyl-carrier-protein] reductase 1, mitochondrial [Diutina catenulata]